MAVFQQCPICRLKQKNSLKKCRFCGEDLVKAKRSDRVKYWICNVIQKKVKWKCIGNSLSDAQDADGKIRAEKRENPFFDVKNTRLNFQDLTLWYLSLHSIQKKRYYKTICYRMKKWNLIWGNNLVINIKGTDILDHQARRIDEGWANSTIDQEIFGVKTMVQLAIDDDRIPTDCIKPFRKVSRLVKGNSNARDRIITLDEFYLLLEDVPEYAKGIVSLGFFGGMRLGEILGLTWDKINLNHEIPHIKLGNEDTKEKRSRIIPLANRIKGNPADILKIIPRALHSDRIFLFQGRPLNRIRDGFKSAVERTGQIYGRFKKDGFIFHDLRHCFATYARRAGIDQLTIMSIMGHSPGQGLQMTARYSTFELRDLGDAISKMEEYLIGRLNHEEDSEKI